MTELRFHRSLYDGASVDEAVKRLGSFATFTLREEPEHWIVIIDGGERERRVAGELGNYALGLTVNRGGAR